MDIVRKFFDSIKIAQKRKLTEIQSIEIFPYGGYRSIRGTVQVKLGGGGFKAELYPY